ncbi:hypothetical protein DLM77_09125 [Leptospira yasudae]|uniref:Tetratricopeptide repeat domain protein n=1 Tax=Leptospira yasudae TaxID=2202201 RepID=A0ABX9M3V6_9LEPT|nr:tetratricopeptide repeat protein [Leptospira yasudae]RHX80025.1 hypothetical protein DLM77_09125 [Leptospira yasudae]
MIRFSAAALALLQISITVSLYADMPLPFPEELEESSVSANEAGTSSSTGSGSAEAGNSADSKSKSLNEGNSQSEGGSEENKNSNVEGSNSSADPNAPKIASSSTESGQEISKTIPEESARPSKTTLPNSEKTNLKKKKDKKKEDPSESGYKKGLLRLRENQRNNAKTEFNQAGQGKSANASRLEDARLTAESSNDANAITEQIDSDEEKWKAVFEVARSLRGNGKIPEAETQYLRIITEAPESFQSISLLSLGEMLSTTDRKDSARRYLLQLVKLLQKKPELDPKKDHLEKGITLIARIYSDQGKYEEAENWAKAYLERLNPDASEDSPFVKELRRILKRRYY